MSGTTVMDLSALSARIGEGWIGADRRPRRGPGAPRGSGGPRGHSGHGRAQTAPHAGAGAAHAGRRLRGRGRGPGRDAEGLAAGAALDSGQGQIRHLAAPGRAEPLLRPAETSARDTDRCAPRAARRGAGSRSRPAGGGCRGARGRGPGPAAAPAARGHRAVPLSGARQYRGRGPDGDQRRGAGKPAVARAAGVETGPGRHAAGRRGSRM